MVSVIGVAALYTLILVGDRFPVVLPETILGLSANAFWILVLFVYAGVASVLPVWMLLQPRDYINGLQLFIGLGILYAAVLISRPTIVAPAINDAVPAGTPQPVAVAVRHHRLRCDLRLPRDGRLRHHVQAARPGG